MQDVEIHYLLIADIPALFQAPFLNITNPMGVLALSLSPAVFIGQKPLGCQQENVNTVLKDIKP
jgi:hypothetical protein